MQRCPRCRTSQRSLVRFGVYLCPTCGETDADGNVLAPAPAGPTGEPPSGRPSFAAPPPPAWVPPGAPEAAAPISSGPPRILVGTISVMVLLDVAGAVLARNACSAIFHVVDVGFLLAVLSGKAWARTLGLFSAMAEILFEIFVLAMLSRVPDTATVTALRILTGLALVASCFWIYVLLRRDVTDYFVRNAR